MNRQNNWDVRDTIFPGMAPKIIPVGWSSETVKVFEGPV